ncbi:ABC transporter ATP-binding protein [Ekhidna sp.]|uniref:ABC transporter ATP-binding protein n=1 Tax=Ekhidna sp. TaxID=2608089 RepID=UPI003B50958F
MSFLKLRNIKKSYSDQAAFACTELDIVKGQKIGIAGETGSGKSTFLKIVSGLEKPEEGEVLIDGVNVYPKLDRLIPGHPDMAYLSQSFELPKFIKVIEFLNASMIAAERLNEIARLCRITDLLKKDTRALSGGERQRVALAKVILKEPNVLLLDEPFTNLDRHHEQVIKEVINDIGEEMGTTILMVSHDPTDLLPWSDKILVLKNGSICQIGIPQEIYKHPKNTYVAGLFGTYQEIDGAKWMDNEKQQMIIRPEQFSLNNHGKVGVIKEILYHGSFELLVVEVDEKRIQAQSLPGVYQVGDRVGVSLIKPS